MGSATSVSAVDAPAAAPMMHGPSSRLPPSVPAVSLPDQPASKLRLKIKVIDNNQSENVIMLLDVSKPANVTQDYILRKAEQLYSEHTGNSTSLAELLTDDNFRFPTGEPLLEYLRDSDKLVARPLKTKEKAANTSAASANDALVAVGSSTNVASGMPAFFCSYCWKNSTNAEEEKEVDAAVGAADPRAIQATLKDRGLLGWLDKEQLGKAGLFDQLCSALLSARVVVAFISDEYAASDNCTMELLYAAKTLRLPIIPVVVGAGMEWMKTKIGLVLAGSLWIDMRNAEKFEESVEQLQARLKQVVGDDVDEEAYKKIAKVADPNNPHVDDGFEVLCHYNEVGNLLFDRSFSQETVRYHKTGLPTEGGPASLLSDYWWPVTVAIVQGDRVKVNYAKYDDWPEEMSWFDKSQLRPVQYATAKIEPDALVGRHVEAKLHQNGSYCWVRGVVTELLPSNRCVVTFDYVPPTPEMVAGILGNEEQGTTIDQVHVDAAECNLAQLRLL